MTTRIPNLERIRAGGKAALARALALVETAGHHAALTELLDAAARDPRADVIGLTGPPGVGKSTLTNALIGAARDAGRTVGVVAVDPSSRFTGGALLGDRIRLRTDPDDQGVFVRSMAARDRLGGLSDHAVAAIVLMRAVYDRVVVESVGIGQSEGDIAFVADTVVLCIQPGSGDSLQFMKAGVMELPDLVAVTKADMGAPARRAKADVEGAHGLVDASAPRAWRAPVVLVSAVTGEGIVDLLRAIDDHGIHTRASNAFTARRRAQEAHWVIDQLTVRYGKAGVGLIAPHHLHDGSSGPFCRIRALDAALSARLGHEPLGL